MNSFLIAPLLLQGLFIAIDEFIFHRRRGLPRWEIWGHPLDTLTVVFVYGFLVYFPYSENLLWAYIALTTFSTLFITKDEFVHSQLCEGSEHWLHAILFVLHPSAFFCSYFLWKEGQSQGFLKTQLILVSLFLIYQILYWGKPWKILVNNPAK